MTGGEPREFPPARETEPAWPMWLYWCVVALLVAIPVVVMFT
jgi:hypothetical protein